MTARVIDAADLPETHGIPPVDAQTVVTPPSEPEPAQGALARLGDVFAETQAAANELRAPVPTWHKRLIGVWRPFTKAEQQILTERAKARAKTIASKDERAKLIALDTIAYSCKALFLDGVEAGGNCMVSAFNDGVAAQLGLKTDDPGLVLWGVIREDMAALNAMSRVVGQWLADPMPKDLTGADGDPFGLA